MVGYQAAHLAHLALFPNSQDYSATSRTKLVALLVLVDLAQLSSGPRALALLEITSYLWKRRHCPDASDSI